TPAPMIATISAIPAINVQRCLEAVILVTSCCATSVGATASTSFVVGATGSATCSAAVATTSSPAAVSAGAGGCGWAGDSSHGENASSSVTVGAVRKSPSDPRAGTTAIWS